MNKNEAQNTKIEKETKENLKNTNLELTEQELDHVAGGCNDCIQCEICGQYIDICDYNFHFQHCKG